MIKDEYRGLVKDKKNGASFFPPLYIRLVRTNRIIMVISRSTQYKRFSLNNIEIKRMSVYERKLEEAAKKKKKNRHTLR